MIKHVCINAYLSWKTQISITCKLTIVFSIKIKHVFTLKIYRPPQKHLLKLQENKPLKQAFDTHINLLMNDYKKKITADNILKGFKTFKTRKSTYNKAQKRYECLDKNKIFVTKTAVYLNSSSVYLVSSSSSGTSRCMQVLTILHFFLWLF